MRPRRPVKMFKTENSFQYQCVKHLNARARPGVWWHHSPNEHVREQHEIIHQKRMGCFFGHWDLVIYKPHEILVDDPVTNPAAGYFIDEPHWLELKQPEGDLSENEQVFRGHLYQRGAKHKVCRDLDTFLNQCIEWELIT